MAHSGRGCGRTFGTAVESERKLTARRLVAAIAGGHQLTSGPFGPAGEIEIVDVVTPHLDGILEFSRFERDAINVVSRFSGVTSHRVGSRNLDQTAAGDFNGDGQSEALVMDRSRRQVIAVQHEIGGAREIWQLDAGAEIVSNFAPVELLDSRLGLAVGTADGRLRVWMPV